LDFILHITYVVDAWCLPSILCSLSLADRIYCRPEEIPTSASVQVVGVDF